MRRKAGNNGSIGVFIHMLSAVQRVLGRNSVRSPAFIIIPSDSGNSGRVKLANRRTGLLSMKATAARASDCASRLNVVTTLYPPRAMSFPRPAQQAVAPQARLRSDGRAYNCHIEAAGDGFR